MPKAANLAAAPLRYTRCRPGRQAIAAAAAQTSKDSGFVWTIQVWVILVYSFGNRAPETATSSILRQPVQ
jgi:hypothetical protein